MTALASEAPRYNTAAYCKCISFRHPKVELIHSRHDGWLYPQNHLPRSSLDLCEYFLSGAFLPRIDNVNL